MNEAAPAVYLAGPGVFRIDAAAHADELKALCVRFGLRPLWPLDNAVDPSVGDALAAGAIRRANENMIRNAAALVADISPFRGPNMDPGTAYEIGFARALGLPVFAYTHDARSLLERSAGRRSASGATLDGQGLLIEDFGLGENLMIATALHNLAPDASTAIAACAASLHCRQVFGGMPGGSPP